MADLPVFRSSKKQKVFRKRDTDDGDDLPSRLNSDRSNNDLPGERSDEESSVSAALKLARKRNAGRKHGIAFSASESQPANGSETDAMASSANALVQVEDLAQNDRFVKPTGRVGIVEDKHLTAYIDTKLAEFRSKSKASVAETAPVPAPVEDESADEDEIMEEDQPEHQGSQPRNPAQTASRPGLIVPIPRANKRPIRRRRVIKDDSTALARAAAVDEIMRESENAMYDLSRDSKPNLRPRRMAPGSSTEGGTAEDLFAEMDNDEAAAESFKAEFLAGLVERKQRRTKPPPARNAPPSQGITPKLGGSRAQRGKMRAAAEEAKAGGAPSSTGAALVPK